jgi:hypothetical protein
MIPLRLRLLLAAAVVLPGLTGCTSLIPKPDAALTGPFYTPANVRKIERMPETIHRIALLPCAAVGPRLASDTLGQLDRVLGDALTRAARAEITQVPRDRLALLTGRPELASTSVLPAELLPRIAADTGADAILFVDVTAYSPYPPLVFGLRARLVDAKDGSSLWNFDNVFTAADPTVVNAARAHSLGRTTSTATPADFSYTVLQNPLTFADYASAATWKTLPAR